jgi:hypothetical protein
MRRSNFVPFGALSILVAAQIGCSSGGVGGTETGRGGSGGTSGTTAGSGGGGGTGGGAPGGGAGTANAGGRGGVSGTSGEAGTAGGGGATGGSAIAGAGGGTGGPATGGNGGSGGSGPGTGGASRGGMGGSSGSPGTAGAAGGTTGGGGRGGSAGSGGGSSGAGGSGGSTATVTCPSVPGGVKSSLYALTAGGTTAFVEQLTKYSPEMQVHYAHCLIAGGGTATFSVTVSGSFTSYTLSPKSRNIATSKSGNTITFTTGPNYLILQVDTKELLFILIDGDETTAPPKLGDANVKNLADYNVDNTGATVVTTKVQSAIDAASGATQNILYVPPGKYTVGELWLRSNMTLYLAAGSVLYGSGATADFVTSNTSGVNIESCQHGMIRMYMIKNTKVLGRGVIDGNGKAIRAQNDTKVNLFKIEQSSNILIDGILVRDPSFWNTLVYRSDMVTIQNYKVVNCRPTTTTYNNTDGVNFDESTNGKLTNAFLYTGDDSMATKNEEPSGTINTKNIVHDKIVCYSNSVCAKVGTKTMGQTIDGVVFSNIDVVKAGRALNIDAYDTATVQNTRYENIRIEAADTSMIDLSSDMPPTWRTAANTSIIKDTYFINVASDVKQPITLHGKSSTVNINGVHFMNLTVQGKAVTTQTDADASWNINSYVTGVVFQ